VKNFVQPGEYGLTVIAPAGGVTSGQVVVVGAIVGVAATTQPAGAEVEVATEGVYTLAKETADLLTQGMTAKLDASNLVAVAGTNPIGWIVGNAAAGTTSVMVKLTPGIAG
jgi:predicted RecA/RadA family phage recombinase